MEFEDVYRLLALLLEADIPVCVVGELALNYYNVPRIVHVGPIPSLVCPYCVLIFSLTGS